MAKYIKFFLKEEQFGIDILMVQEIILPHEFALTRIPNGPAHLQGVINLRGMIVPFIDLRVRLGLPPVPPGEETRAIILKIAENKVVSVLVDALSEVVEVPKGAIEPMRSSAAIIDAEHIIGVYKQTEALVVLVDIKSVIYDAAPAEETASVV